MKNWSKLGTLLLLAAITSQTVFTQPSLGGAIEDDEVSHSYSIIGVGPTSGAAKANAHAELQALIQVLNEASEGEVTVTIESEGFLPAYYWFIDITLTYAAEPPPID